MTREERLELLKQIEKDIHVCSLESTLRDDLKSCAIHSAIEELEQEPRKGHWIPTYGNVKCSVCGSVKDSRDVGKATHYCDFCGAKMVELQESER